MDISPETEKRLSRGFRNRLLSDLFSPLRVQRELMSAVMALSPLIVVKTFSTMPDAAALMDDPLMRFMAEYGSPAGVVGSVILLLLASAKSLLPPALMLVTCVAMSLLHLNGWAWGALAVALLGMLVNNISPYQSA